MKKEENKKPKDEVHTFRTFEGTENYFKEVLGLKIDSDKNVVNHVCSDFIKEIVASDITDIFDHRIYLNNKKINETTDAIDDVDAKILRLKTELNKLNEKKTEYTSYLTKLKKENNEYIIKKKKYEETSIKSIIDKVLLIYTSDISNFTDITIQNVFSEYTYPQNYIIEILFKFLDDNMNKEIVVIDKNSDNKTEYSINLNYPTVTDIKKILNTLIIKK